MTEVLLKAPMILYGLHLDKSRLILTQPEPLNIQIVMQNLFELPLRWLYFHELGHLAEGHGALPKAGHIVQWQAGTLEISESPFW